MMWQIAVVTGVLGVMASAFVASANDGQKEGESPFVCNLNALTTAERATHRQLTERLVRSIQQMRELTNGYAFDLGVDRVPLADAAMWVGFERRCCPFFDFQLELRRENGPLTLRLTGREGTKAFIRAEFKPVFREG
jgi:hypothetical protein